MRNRITLIGGSGFIGSYILRELDNAQFNKYLLSIIDKVQPKNNQINSKIVDIRDRCLLNSSIETSEWVIHLAAEHRDDVTPKSLYFDVNVNGTKNIIDAMDFIGCKKIFFFSSVAIYGLNKNNPDIDSPTDPFNAYGESKLQAEELLKRWYSEDPQNKTLIIIRPTVVFGNGNRGNVYNLLRQIISGSFIMIGKGENKKSMAYVENISSFVKYCIDKKISGYHIFNYADKPDLSTSDLVRIIQKRLRKKEFFNRFFIPVWIGYLIGIFFDFMSAVTHRKYNISMVRVKKFCSNTQFSAQSIENIGFQAPYTLHDGLFKTIDGILNNSDIEIGYGGQ